MKTMQLWSPINDIWNMQDEFDKFFGLSRRKKRGRNDEESDGATWAPLVDISEDLENVKVCAELPGMKKEDVKIAIDDGVLTIKGERKFNNESNKEDFYRVERYYGSFCRSFSLPNNVEVDKIKAAMKDGILELKLPKKEESKPKEIEIEVK